MPPASEDRTGQPQTSLDRPVRTAGEPVSFAGCTGFFHAASGEVAVLMIQPWGFEAFSIRESWRALAETLAGERHPCLRFDLPGTGDALGDDVDIVDLDVWRDAVRTAAAELRRLADTRRLIVLGQGLGAGLAQDVADLIGAEGLIALAPMAEGRAGLRELRMWSGMLASTLALPSDPDAVEALNVAGFRMSRPLADRLEALQWRREAAVSCTRALVLVRAARTADTRFVETLRARGIAVETVDFVGHDELMTTTARSKTPWDDWRRIARWISATFPSAGRAVSFAAPPPAVLETPVFREEAICFGPAGALFGVLCTPVGVPRPPVAIFVGSGYNAHIGWARGHVDLGRRLARRGIASFRMTGARIGDSGIDPDGPTEVLYDDSQIAEARRAIDVVVGRDLGPVILVGRCSGAYVVLHAAEEDERVAAVVAVNALRLVWNPDETLADAMTGGSGSLKTYGRRLRSRELLDRIRTLDLPFRRVGRDVAIRLKKRVTAAFAGLSGKLTLMGRLYARVNDRFAGLHARGVPVSLIYADNDAGLDELAVYCGRGGKRLGRWPSVTLTVVDAADHDMTSARAQTVIFDHIVDVTARVRQDMFRSGRSDPIA